MSENSLQSSENYIKTLDLIKQKIKTAQLKAAMAANSELIMLYWEIGKTILDRQKEEGWGTKVIDKLSADLLKSFPEMKGFSTRNLKYMRQFAESYSEIEIVQQVAAQIPWWHNVILLNRIKTTEERIWYAKKVIENGWSRNTLVIQIESKLYKRQAISSKTTNFEKTLTPVQSDMAREVIKDPYVFDFLTLTNEYKEKEIEGELVKHITHFLLELGSGFAFVGQQYKIEVSNRDFYIDLLFYHIKLKCYVVIEIKAGEFKPEYAGKLNFYLSAVDDILKGEENNPTIGIILCRVKDKIIAEYALRKLDRPIGVSEYQLVKTIPEEIKSSLPSIEEIEEELSRGLSETTSAEQEDMPE